MAPQIPAPPLTSAPTACGLLVLPGWDDDGQQQYTALQTALQRQHWVSRRANLPDSSWPRDALKATSRPDALQQAFDDYEMLASGLRGGPVAAMGFSFGAYLATYLTTIHPVRCLVLRSPALYPDKDWSTPKEELDKRDLAAYRQAIHPPESNGALAACSRYDGDVLLVDSENDQIIPSAVIASYEAAFTTARSLSRYTIKQADHQLTDPSWQAEYRDVLLGWLNDRMPRVDDPMRAITEKREVVIAPV